MSTTATRASERLAAAPEPLAVVLRRLADPSGVDPSQPVSVAYPADMQRLVLGLDDAALTALREPILDLGCGPSAELVAELRRRGLDAHGIDRAVAPGPHTAPGDWLTCPLGRERWGTILSHQAFSVGFLYAHLGPDDGTAARYAARYLQLLAALRPRGSLRYAPGLPFMERLLAPPYRVRRLALAAASDPAWPGREQLPDHLRAALLERCGGDVLYCAQVQREETGPRAAGRRRRDARRS